MIKKLLISLSVMLFAFATILILISVQKIERGKEVMARADAILEKTPETKTYIPEPRNYTWEMEMCARVVGFEVGLCCDKCKFYVASACVNRMHYWYNDKPIAMITDYSDETGYYMMYPGYAYEDEFYGYSFSEHKYELLPYVWDAEKAPADVWYWDCDDTQGAWADLYWYCEEDDMYYWTARQADRWW